MLDVNCFHIRKRFCREFKLSKRLLFFFSNIIELQFMTYYLVDINYPINILNKKDFLLFPFRIYCRKLDTDLNSKF